MQTISYFKFYFLYLFFYTPILLHPQNKANGQTLIKGEVLDALTKEAIPYGTIRVYEDVYSDQVFKVVSTHDNGDFQFNMDKKGNYIMLIESIGKIKVNRTFSVGDTRIVDIGSILMSDDAEVLSEVVISAQKPLVKVHIDKITYSTEDDPESATSSILDILKKVPMVTVDGEDNIQLKGSFGYTIYMDGKPSVMITNNPKDVLKSMPASSVKTIEVITEPGAKYDAEGLAGIINIITQKHSSISGYNVSVNTKIDSRNGYRFGGSLSLKKAKIGFTGNYNYYLYNDPKFYLKSLTENTQDTDFKYLIQNSIYKYKGHGHYGSGVVSYEIDSLNLVTLGFDKYYGQYNQNVYSKTEYENVGYNTTQEYEQWTKGDNHYGWTAINVDYQNISRIIDDRVFTLSYRFNKTPDKWSSDNKKNSIYNASDFFNIQFSDSELKEHTFQLDYTTPFAKIHTLEGGVKYILRFSDSNNGYRYKLSKSNDWTNRMAMLDKFKHDQNIIATYLGYGLNLTKLAFKAGLRYEHTDVKVKYPIDNESDFSDDYYNFIPSLAITYKPTSGQDFRLGYNMRILRPDIWQLNPFPNTTDLTDITTGNPRLKAVKSHTIVLNYSYLNSSLNVNTDLSYDFSSNNVESIIKYQEGVRKTTYGNIGDSKRLGLCTYINWSLTNKVKITSNLSGSYINVKSNDEHLLKNDGFNANVYINVAYTFPQKIRITGYGGARTRYITLQSEGGASYYYGLSLSKDLFKDKLTVNLSGSNFLENSFTNKKKTTSASMRINTEANFKRNWISLSLSFKFGGMKDQIRKTSRTITNDDYMSKSSGGNNGEN